MKLSKIISYVLISLCVCLCFYISIEVVVAIKKELPVSLFSYSISYVPTDSMEDEIMPGEYVLFKKTNFSKIDEGDIVVYKSKTGEMAGRFIIHRVIEEHDDYFVTQGDNNPLPDEEQITSDMIVGRYVKVLGFMDGIASNKKALAIILFIIVFLGLGFQFINGYVKNKQQELNDQKQKEKEDLIEQLKKEILEEELEKIKNSKK